MDSTCLLETSILLTGDIQDHVKYLMILACLNFLFHWKSLKHLVKWLFWLMMFQELSTSNAVDPWFNDPPPPKSKYWPEGWHVHCRKSGSLSNSMDLRSKDPWQHLELARESVNGLMEPSWDTMSWECFENEGFVNWVPNNLIFHSFHSWSFPIFHPFFANMDGFWTLDQLFMTFHDMFRCTFSSLLISHIVQIGKPQQFLRCGLPRPRLWCDRVIRWAKVAVGDQQSRAVRKCDLNSKKMLLAESMTQIILSPKWTIIYDYH